MERAFSRALVRGRQQQCSQDCYDRYHDKEFDECENLSFHFFVSFCLIVVKLYFL